MSDFVDECRREWKRLHVPDPLANEMAADLAADLQDAEADGASAEDVLGNAAFDPRTFAASWARERGVIKPRLRDRYRGRTAVALGAVLVAVIAVGVVLVVLLSSSGSRHIPASITTSPAPTTTTAGTVAVPNLIGLGQAEAITAAQAAGIAVSVVYANSDGRHGIVVAERPSPGTTISRGATLQLRVSR